MHFADHFYRLRPCFTHFVIRTFHTHSVRKLVSRCFFLLTAFSLLVFFLCSAAFFRQMALHISLNMKNSLELYNDEISRDLDDAITFLTDNCFRNADISSLNTSHDRNEIYLHTVKIQKTLSTTTFPNIGGLFIYSQSQDIFIPQVNETWDLNQNNTKASYLIKDILRERNQNDSLKNLPLNQWFLMREGEDYFLFHIINKRNTYAGAWTSLNLTASTYQYFKDMQASILYVDQNGSVLGNPLFEGSRLDPEKSVHFFRNYLAVSNPLDYCDYYIMAMIPASYLLHLMAPLLTAFLIIMTWILLFCLAVSFLMKHFINAPSAILQPVIQSMRSGEFHSQIESSSPFEETQNVIDTFNEMISEIQNLRINIYEQKIARTELELQYLKMQIAPHFLINCLNTIFTLSQDKANQDITHLLIQTLSDHLRYTLSTRTEVALSEEIHYVKNYLTLTKLRFPGSLSYDIRIESSLDNAQVFPLILLMLTENSIKENLVMGETFFIRIHGYSYQKGNATRVHLVHIDSGAGFDREQLLLFNHIEERPLSLDKGSGIGIYNTVRRLKLTMGETPEILFSNEPDAGARIDIDFPYRRLS